VVQQHMLSPGPLEWQNIHHSWNTKLGKNWWERNVSSSRQKDNSDI